jgi:hypothetical protein
MTSEHDCKACVDAVINGPRGKFTPEWAWRADLDLDDPRREHWARRRFVLEAWHAALYEFACTGAEIQLRIEVNAG